MPKAKATKKEIQSDDILDVDIGGIVTKAPVRTSERKAGVSKAKTTEDWKKSLDREVKEFETAQNLFKSIDKAATKQPTLAKADGTVLKEERLTCVPASGLAAQLQKSGLYSPKETYEYSKDEVKWTEGTGKEAVVKTGKAKDAPSGFTLDNADPAKRLVRVRKKVTSKAKTNQAIANALKNTLARGGYQQTRGVSVKGDTICVYPDKITEVDAPSGITGKEAKLSKRAIGIARNWYKGPKMGGRRDQLVKNTEKMLVNSGTADAKEAADWGDDTRKAM